MTRAFGLRFREPKNAASITALLAPDGRYYIYDTRTPGLICFVTRNGTRTCSAHQALHGKLRRLPCVTSRKATLGAPQAALHIDESLAVAHVSPEGASLVCICVALCRKLGISVVEDAVGAEVDAAREP